MLCLLEILQDEKELVDEIKLCDTKIVDNLYAAEESKNGNDRDIYSRNVQTFRERKEKAEKNLLTTRMILRGYLYKLFE